MRIGIYVDVANQPELRGIGYHVQQLIYGLSRIDTENEYFLYYRSDLFQRRSMFPHCPNQSNFHSRPVRFLKKWISNYPVLWWNYYLPLAIRADQIEFFHGPNYFLPAIPGQKMVVTIHDLAFYKMELYPSGWTAALRFWTEKSLRSAGRVIAISENTRKDIEALGVEPKKIQVIHNAGHVIPEESIQYDRLQEVLAAFNLPKHYILFVGVLHQRKNVPFLVRSYAKLRQEAAIPHGLVLAGFKGPATEEIEKLVQELDIASDVIITGYIKDWQLPLLYKNADIFVLPTLYEGFTLVTLEAMSYGVPVVATDCSSIREGVGDAASLVPCNDVDAMVKAIRDILFNETLQYKMISLGIEQSKKFTWDRCARETLSLYTNFYEENDPMAFSSRVNQRALL